ncbi:hypothetical protein HAX54_027416, partial [Datura stramonium]|nr:hypothetical protein [Datura stramonium]
MKVTKSKKVSLSCIGTLILKTPHIWTKIINGPPHGSHIVIFPLKSHSSFGTPSSAREKEHVLADSHFYHFDDMIMVNTCFSSCQIKYPIPGLPHAQIALLQPCVIFVIDNLPHFNFPLL